MEPMTDLKIKLLRWLPRRFRKKNASILEPIFNPVMAAGARLYPSRIPAAFMYSQILLEKAHYILRSRKWYRVTIGILMCTLVAVSSYAYLGMKYLRHENAGPAAQVLQFETKRAAGGEDYLVIGRLIDWLVDIGTRTRKPQINSVLQTENWNGQELLVKQELIALMKEFGAEEYNIPPEFLAEVNRFICQYQERDHDIMARALLEERADLERMRQILLRDHLPQDLAYMVLVESAFLRSSESQNGAMGLWQFTEETAREYGMEVNETVDERLDLSKSTVAASRYLRDLILDFGAGSSVMLALAAYNSGPEKVRRAVRSVKDPIKQRNFWHLYRTHALPAETRAYVPKVIAAILIGRNPGPFGF
jgi:soluble lytic murein transglycosylase-like protein